MSSFTISCPHCGQSLEADDSLVGQTAECPACGKPFEVSARQTSVPGLIQKSNRPETKEPSTPPVVSATPISGFAAFIHRATHPRWKVLLVAVLLVVVIVAGQHEKERQEKRERVLRAARESVEQFKRLQSLNPNPYANQTWQPQQWSGPYQPPRNNTNMGTCRSCGRPISVRATTCPFCGDTLAPRTGSGYRIRPDGSIGPDDRF